MSEPKRQEPLRPMKGVRLPGQKADMKTVKRVLSYLFEYKWHLAFVFIGIMISSLAGVYGSKFLETLVDDYIKPLMLDNDPSFDGLLREIVIVGIVYALGALSTYLYNRIMVTVSQSVLKNLRDTMFAKMQTFPVKYFDTHSFGDTMSRYTNDTDTLRMMISQSIPSVASSLFNGDAILFVSPNSMGGMHHVCYMGCTYPVCRYAGSCDYFGDRCTHIRIYVHKQKEITASAPTSAVILLTN